MESGRGERGKGGGGGRHAHAKCWRNVDLDQTPFSNGFDICGKF